jgi:26S proteasome regulatory subunit N12
MADAAAKALATLKTQYAAGDTAKASATLTQLKLQLCGFTALPPTYAQTPTAQKELTVGREVLEYAVLLSVKLQDQALFERQFNQLNTFYTDTRHVLATSEQEMPIVGMNLLRLMVQNRTAEFHTQLELLSPETQQNVYIKHAIELEQYLMEGAYNKVIHARQSIPAEPYAYFMDLLMHTVRDEIAACCEKAYPRLTVQGAQELLAIPQQADVLKYATERGWERDTAGCFVFHHEEQALSAKDIPSLHLIGQSLGYAKELERIV